LHRAVTTLRVLLIIAAVALAAVVLSYAGLSILARRALNHREFGQLSAAILRATPAHVLGENPVETIRLGGRAFGDPAWTASLRVDTATHVVPLPPRTVQMSSDPLRFVTFASAAELNEYLQSTLQRAGWRHSDQFGSMHLYQNDSLQLSVRSAFFRGTRIGELRFMLTRHGLSREPVASAPPPPLPLPTQLPGTSSPTVSAPPLPKPRAGDTSALHPRTRALPLRQLFREHNSGFTDRVRIILGDSAEWRDFWLRAYSMGSLPPRPTVDFASEVVVGVAMGRRATGGYSIHIDSARTTFTGVEIFVRSVSPGRRCGTTAALTEPAAAAAIPRTSLSPRIIEIADTVRCR
jgi:hypothetical protein